MHESGKGRLTFRGEDKMLLKIIERTFFSLPERLPMMVSLFACASRRQDDSQNVLEALGHTKPETWSLVYREKLCKISAESFTRDLRPSRGALEGIGADG